MATRRIQGSTYATIPVTTNAVIKRVRRDLEKLGERLVIPKTRHRDCYVIDPEFNAITREHFSPIDYAIKHGILRPFEYIKD